MPAAAIIRRRWLAHQLAAQLQQRLLPLQQPVLAGLNISDRLCYLHGGGGSGGQLSTACTLLHDSSE